MSEQHGNGPFRSSSLKDPNVPETPPRAWIVQTFHFAHGNPVSRRHACWRRGAYDEQRRLAREVCNDYSEGFFEFKSLDNDTIQQVNLHLVIKITYTVEDAG